jgi:hypothetical protein
MSPDYGSDYRYSYINGSLEHRFGLPGVDCDVCGQTWGGSRVLPYEYLNPFEVIRRPQTAGRYREANTRRSNKNSLTSSV